MRTFLHIHIDILIPLNLLTMTLSRFSFFATCILWCQILAGQDPNQTLDPGDKEASQADTLPRFVIQGGVMLGLNKPDPLQVDGVYLQEVTISPSVFLRLFETLGGEFYIGNLSGEPVDNLSLTGRLQPMPGLTGGIKIGPSFEFMTSIHLFRVAWKGDFPITVFPSDGSSPIQHEAELFQSSKGTLLNASLKAFLMPTRLRPYIEVGGRAQLVVKHLAEIRVNGGEVAFNEEAFDHEFSPFAAFGLRADIYKRFYGDVVLSFGKLPGVEWTPALGFSFGFWL
jgi:hypothetical protein